MTVEIGVELVHDESAMAFQGSDGRVVWFLGKKGEVRKVDLKYWRERGVEKVEFGKDGGGRVLAFAVQVSYCASRRWKRN